MIKRDKIEINDDKEVNNVAMSGYYLLMKGNEPFFSVRVFNFLQKVNNCRTFSSFTTIQQTASTALQCILWIITLNMHEIKSCSTKIMDSSNVGNFKST